METVSENLKNIKILLYHIIDFIKDRKLENNREKDIPSLIGFGQVACLDIYLIYIMVVGTL